MMWFLQYVEGKLHTKKIKSIFQDILKKELLKHLYIDLSLLEIKDKNYRF